MSVNRVSLFHCDVQSQNCTFKEISDYRLPKDWKYIVEHGKVIHACSSCSAKLLSTGKFIECQCSPSEIKRK